MMLFGGALLSNAEKHICQDVSRISSLKLHFVPGGFTLVNSCMI